MTAHFQSGQHPDADQLNAFVEHALPLHEQQATLAHLSACADCRAIVYLAQSAIPESETQPHPLPARTSFFSRWMLAFPAAAALACLILLTIHIRNAANANSQVAAVDRAPLKQTPPPQAPPTAPAVPPVPAPTQIHKPQTAAAPSPHAIGAASAASATGPNELPPPRPLSFAAPSAPGIAPAAGAPLEKKALAGAVSGASYVSAAPAPAPPPAAASASPQSPLIAGIEARRELRSAASQYDAGRAQAQQAPGAGSGAVASNGAAGIYGGTGQTNLNQNYIEGVAASNAPAQPASAATAETTTASAANETVTVTNAASTIDTIDAATLQTKVLPRLPSKRPVLSIVSNAHRQLAIDTAGALFRSDDAGVTWLPVPAQWTGRAVKVALVPSPNPHPFARSAGSLAGPIDAAKPSTLPSSTFELTTDAGDLWTSPDGRVWKRK